MGNPGGGGGGAATPGITESDVSQQKMETQPVHVTNLQTMCRADFRTWLPFDHNNIGHYHQQNLTAPEQIYPACPAFTKIHQCTATT